MDTLLLRVAYCVRDWGNWQAVVLTGFNVSRHGRSQLFPATAAALFVTLTVRTEQNARTPQQSSSICALVMREAAAGVTAAGITSRRQPQTALPTAGIRKRVLVAVRQLMIRRLLQYLGGGAVMAAVGQVALAPMDPQTPNRVHPAKHRTGGRQGQATGVGVSGKLCQGQGYCEPWCAT